MAEEVKRRVIFDLVSRVDGYLADIAKAQQTTQEATSAMSASFARMGSGINSVIGITGTLTGILAGGAAFKSMVSATSAFTGEVVKLSKALGESPEKASVLNVALRTLGIDSDVVTNAAIRLANSIRKDGGASVQALGVSVKDANGNLRSTIDIMGDVNAKLLQSHEGLERNIKGTSIYSKGWTEAQQTLRLTSAELIAAKQKAEDLHLIMGGDGATQVREYKRNINELELVATSLKVNLGRELIPVLNDLGKAFARTGVEGAGFFARTLHQGLVEAAQTKSWLQRQLKRLPNDQELGSLLFGDSGEYRARQGAMDQLDAYTLERLSERYGGLTTPINRARMPEKSPSSFDPTKGSGGKSAAEKKNYTEDAPGFMNWRRRQADEEEELKWLAERNKELEKAQEELQKIYAEMDRDELENGLMKSDAYLNAIGKISESQQALLDQSSMLSTWAARNSELDEAARKSGETFLSMNGMGGSPAVLALQQEQSEIIKSWVMMTDSFEEEARRRTLVEQVYSERRMAIERAESVAKLNGVMMYTNAAGNLFGSLYEASGRKLKAFFYIQQTANAASAVMSGFKAGAAALEPPPVGLGPVAGGGLSALMIAGGFASAAAIMAQTLAGPSGGGGGSVPYSGGSYPSGNYSSPVVTQPVGGQTQQQGDIVVVLKGIPNGKYIEEELIPGLNEAGSRNIRVEYLNEH